MAIETVQREAGQTKLIEESPEERKHRLYELRRKIKAQEAERQQYINKANALKNAIKASSKEEDDLLAILDSGQGTFIPVAVSDSAEAPEGMEMDIPSDDELEEFADLVDEQDEETTSDEDTEGGNTEPGEPDSDGISEGATENPAENMPENIPAEEPDFQLATPDHWRLMDFDTLILLGKVKSKKDPIVGAIYGLPSTLWNKDGKTHYQVQGASVTEEDGEAYWECYVDLLTEAEVTLAAQNNEGAA